MTPSVHRETRKFSADEVLEMLRVGILQDGEPLELLEGELVCVSPQGSVHSSLTVRIRRLLERAYGDAFHVRDHSPVRGSADSLPEPDLAVTHGTPDDFMQTLPGVRDVPLVVEISFSTRTTDRRKARIYARAGYGTYWLVDVDARRLEVRTSPNEGGEYRTTHVLDESAQVNLPENRGALGVRDLLP
jgi:Uma2 family endonuclease